MKYIITLLLFLISSICFSQTAEIKQIKDKTEITWTGFPADNYYYYLQTTFKGKVSKTKVFSKRSVLRLGKGTLEVLVTGVDSSGNVTGTATATKEIEDSLPKINIETRWLITKEAPNVKKVSVWIAKPQKPITSAEIRIIHIAGDTTKIPVTFIPDGKRLKGKVTTEVLTAIKIELILYTADNGYYGSSKNKFVINLQAYNDMVSCQSFSKFSDLNRISIKFESAQDTGRIIFFRILNAKKINPFAVSDTGTFDFKPGIKYHDPPSLQGQFRFEVIDGNMDIVSDWYNLSIIHPELGLTTYKKIKYKLKNIFFECECVFNTIN